MVFYGCFLIGFAYVVLVATPLTERLYLWLTVTQSPEKADVIVCLGGQPERMFWAAELYHQGYAPKVAVSSWENGADKMYGWVHMCGVPAEDVWVDRYSRTTGDHPDALAALPGIDKESMRFLIVTNHEHSRRVRAVFQRAGYRNFMIYGGDPPFANELDPGQRWRWRFLRIPSLVYEYAALAKYKLQGRI
jgi:uncharacterized SAM-binding protein YcdF (DUF218 family)